MHIHMYRYITLLCELCECASYTKRSRAHIIAHCCKFMCSTVGRLCATYVCVHVDVEVCANCAAAVVCSVQWVLAYLVCQPLPRALHHRRCGGGISPNGWGSDPHKIWMCGGFLLASSSSFHMFCSVRWTSELASVPVCPSVRSFVHSLARARARARTQFNVVVALFSHTHIYIYTSININMCARSVPISHILFPHACLSVAHAHTHMEWNSI